MSNNNSQKELTEAAVKAADLVKTTADQVAMALVKFTSDTTTMALNIQYIQKDIVRIEQTIKEIKDMDNTYVKKEDFEEKDYVLKEEFLFWRNLLVGGLLTSIVTGILVRFIVK